MARRGILVAPFEELADARALARLAARAERAGWDGLFPIDLPGPEALAEIAAEARAERPDGAFAIVVTNPAGTQPPAAEVEAAIDG